MVVHLNSSYVIFFSNLFPNKKCKFNFIFSENCFNIRYEIRIFPEQFGWNLSALAFEINIWEFQAEIIIVIRNSDKISYFEGIERD